MKIANIVKESLHIFWSTCEFPARYHTRIYVLHKITMALKFMSHINSDLPVPVKKLQTPG